MKDHTFKNNKYSSWYFSIIKNAKNQIRNGYVERHHIIPRSFGGSNKKENIVALTPREHYICHLLLTKMTSGNERYKMAFALSMLIKVKNIGEGRHIVTGRLYEYARRIYKEAFDNYWTDERRLERSNKYKELKIAPPLWTPEQIENFKKTKIWTDAAKENRLKNCLESAAKRKGKKNPKHGTKIFYNYVTKNVEIIRSVWKLHEQGLNRRNISMQLGISWDRANLAINKKIEIETLLGELKLLSV